MLRTQEELRRTKEQRRTRSNLRGGVTAEDAEVAELFFAFQRDHLSTLEVANFI